MTSVTIATPYAGEVIPLWQTAVADTSEGPVDLRPDNVDRATLVIYRRGEVIAAETEMPWSSEEGRWRYDWETDGLEPGSYLVKFLVYDLLGRAVWEFMDFRLIRNRA